MKSRRWSHAGFARVIALSTLAVIAVAGVAVLAGAKAGSAAEEGGAYVATGGPSASELLSAEPAGAEALGEDTESSWAALAAGDEFFVTTAAHVTGSGGTNWRTDLEVHNWGSTQASYTIALFKKDNDNGSPQTANYSLGAGQAARYSDAFSALFGFTGGGALRVTCNGGSIIVTSRTYNDQPGGTYGQFVRGRPLAEGVAYGEYGRIIQLTHNRSAGSGYRTNFMAVNATSGTIQVVAEFYAANGSYLGQQQLTLRSYEYKQIDKVFEQVTGGDVADGYAVVRTTTAGGRFFSGCSVIDNRTGDAVFVPHEKTTGGGGGGGGSPSYGPLQFSLAVDGSCNPSNPTSSFPNGTTTVYGSFPYSNVTAGQGYERKWYSNGSLVLTGSGTFSGTSGRICGSINNASGLNVGTYRLDIVVSGAVVLSGEFTIASGGGGTPSYGPLVFSSDVNLSTGDPINPGTTFAYGLTTIYASFPYSNVTVGTGWTGKWYVNGTLAATLNRTFPSTSGRQYAALARGGSALDPGTYLFELYVNSVIVLQGQCTISSGGGGGGASYGPMTFATQFNESTGQPLNPGTSFPYGATTLYGSFPYSGVTAGTAYTTKWYVNGSLQTTSSSAFPNTSGSRWNAIYKPGGVALDSGTYRLDLVVGGVVVLSGQATIGGGGGGGGGTVNLVPVTPSGWQYPVVPASEPGTHQVGAFLSHYYITYVDWAVGNQGPSNINAGNRIYVYLLLDGSSIHGWYSDAGLPAGTYLAVQDYQIPAQSIPIGTHSLGVQADPTTTITESNEGDNTWSHSFQWTNIVGVSPLERLVRDAATARLPAFTIEPLPESAIRKLP